MKNTKNKLAFTFVELIISTVIIVLLSSIWFYSYVWYLSEARDSERRADLWTIKSSLKLYKQKRWTYPIAWDYFSITNSWTVVAYQWELNEKVALNTLDSLPYDPLTDTAYTYSTTKNKQEFQLAITLENSDVPIALLEWDYQSASVNILPTITLAIDSTTDVEIKDWLWNWTTNRQYFILNWWKNLPYTLVAPFEPEYWYSSLDIWTDIIDLDLVDYWQNIDFLTCSEIEEAWKSIWDWEYQILSNTWALTNTWCTF